MGLERLAAILQGKISNYQCDLLMPIVEKGAELFARTYGEDGRVDVALRIAADHARATTFLIHDGVLPANDGRGYVLRKIMRRAMRNARMVGVEDPFLYQLTGFVAEWMRPAYPELMESVQRVARIVKDEEHRYATTFQVAEKVFHDEARAAAGGILPGPAAFKLYDTYGLALDEMQEMARERGLGIDLDGFDEAMEQQRQRARASWKGAEKAQVAPAYQTLLEKGRTKFLGYQALTAAANVTGLLNDSKEIVTGLPAGATGELVLDQTPFYAETGGQVGDKGALYRDAVRVADVETTYPAVPGLSVHKIRTLAPIAAGDTLECRVDPELRVSTMRNHTATHLLHAALRRVLGTHVKQAGSVVDPGRLRFDFTHYTAMDPDELAEVERLANEQILNNLTVDTNVMPLDEAIKTGAMALFGEKYGDEVRVVTAGDFSRELCGGTHVGRTGDIGLCKITSEGSISSGVRRIEAVTGETALDRFRAASESLGKIAFLLRSSESELVDQVERMSAHQKVLEKQVEQLKGKLAQSQLGGLEEQARVLKGVKVLASRVDGFDRNQLRTLADSLRNKWQTAVVVLASAEDSQIALVSAVTKDLTAKVHAGKLVGSVSQSIGGKGGGRPDMAEGGGKDPAALGAALEKVYANVESMLG
jgi:alanyl-tRNA synthetase